MMTDLMTTILAAAVCGGLSFWAGCLFMGTLLRRAISDERARLRECLDRGHRLVHTGEDVIRRMRDTL